MLRCTLVLVVCTLITLVCAEIFWPDCESQSDHWGIPNGNLYNLCIIDHEFVDARHSWNLFNATLSGVQFKNSIFVNEPYSPNNFTETTWNNVKFDGCYFGSIDAWQENLVFERTTFNNVEFANSVFDHSIRVIVQEFAMWNVSFVNCTFRGDTMFTLGQVDRLSIIDSRVRHSDYSTITRGNDSFTFRKVSMTDVTILDSTFVSPLRFEAVEAKRLSINDTDVVDFACRSDPTEKDAELLLSSFNDTVFQTVSFSGRLTCDSTTWFTMHMLNATFLHETDFSRSKFVNIYWDEIESRKSFGDCHTFNFSMSSIEGRVFANASVACTADFRNSVFEYVYVKSFRAETPLFSGATFQKQEYIDGSCCSLACQSLGCFCNVTLPSGQCPVAGRDVNLTAPLEDGACFPGDSTVTISDGSTVMIKDLKVGTHVLSDSGTFSPVFMFGHRDTKSWMPVIEIRAAGSSGTVRMSPGHYLYVDGRLRTAEKVVVGDMVTTATGESVPVIEVTKSVGHGMYAPTTMSGSLVVDGVLASAYTNAVHPSVAHWLLAPMRLMYRARLLPHLSWLERRSWAWLARKLRVARGPDTFGTYGTLTDTSVSTCRV